VKKAIKGLVQQKLGSKWCQLTGIDLVVGRWILVLFGATILDFVKKVLAPTGAKIIRNISR
jgi:hypothetical protein